MFLLVIVLCPEGKCTHLVILCKMLLKTESFFEQSPVDIVTGGISPIRDLDRLLQDMDINRLRAVVFRDIVSYQSCCFLCS